MGNLKKQVKDKKYKEEKVLLVWNGSIEGTSGQLFRALSDFLGERHSIKISNNKVCNGGFLRKLYTNILSNIGRIRSIFWCTTIIVHSYAALSLPSIMLAWLIQRKIVVFHWDIYPVICSGKRLGGRKRQIFDWLEGLTCRFATSVVIPSQDFRPFVDHQKVIVIPLWPSDSNLTDTTTYKRVKVSHSIKVVFTGQFGLTRGLREAILLLGTAFDTQVELHIFGPSPPQDELKVLSPNVSVTFRGHESPSTLQNKIRNFDFGLVSLNPSMETPGFPSKVFEYVKADLPVIYTGPALPAFEELLTSTGVGVTLRDTEVIQVLQPRSWQIAKAKFYSRTSLNWVDLEKIF